MNADIVIIGGGVIGLSIARELARRGSVLLIERGAIGEGASWAAAGMLSPQSEANHNDPFFQLGMASLRMYHPFIAELRAESSVDPDFSETGLIVLATSSEELSTLESRARWQKEAGLSIELLNSRDVFKLEPLITTSVTGALYLPHDCQVAPRPLSKALAEACRRRGVEIRTGVSVDAILRRDGGVTGVRVGAETIPARCVIVASGVSSPAIDGLDPKIPVYPRKGQILSLAMRRGSFHRMIRWSHAYFVPRRNGELVVGATNENCGFDLALTPAGIGHLLAEAQRVSSHTGAFPIQETWAGLRPATPDEWPVIGHSNIEGLIYATGHYRNGILLAPITAVIIDALISGGEPPVRIESFNPRRFNV